MDLSSIERSYHSETIQSIPPSETVKIALRALKRFGQNAYLGLREIGQFDKFGVPVYKVEAPHRFNEFGKGLTKNQCMASALMERVERMSAAFKYNHNFDITTTSFDELDNAISRKDFGLLNIHRVLRMENSIDTMPVDWIPAYSFSQKKSVYVPAQQVLLNAPNRMVDYSCSNGLAAGNSMEEAILQGICEVIERHVYHVMYYQKPSVKKVDISGISHPTGQQLVKELQKSGFELLVHDFSSDWGVSIVSVFLMNPKEKQMIQTYHTCGVSINPEMAFIRALTELLQARAISYHDGQHSSERGFFFGASRDNVEVFKWLKGCDEEISLESLPHSSTRDVKNIITTLVSKIKNKGYDVLVSDLTHSRLNIPVAKVLIPGLQPNFLYLGWHHLDKRSCVTSHLPIFDEVISACTKRQTINQSVDELHEVPR